MFQNIRYTNLKRPVTSGIRSLLGSAITVPCRQYEGANIFAFSFNRCEPTSKITPDSTSIMIVVWKYVVFSFMRSMNVNRFFGFWTGVCLECENSTCACCRFSSSSDWFLFILHIVASSTTFTSTEPDDHACLIMEWIFSFQHHCTNRVNIDPQMTEWFNLSMPLHYKSKHITPKSYTLVYNATLERFHHPWSSL